jgi:beta-galactosidase
MADRILSGAVHYFRVLPPHWPHRLGMLRAMGLNTVETYVPWNLHEPRPGTFERLDDLDGFLDAAAAAGLRAIVRPGPYICAEWDNGGLPIWLSGPLRCSDPSYLAAVDSWFDVLIPRIAARQVTRGGNVIMVQVENEYGAYGDDQAYLQHLADGLRARGIDVPLFTSDQPKDEALSGGSIPGVRCTVNFGKDPESAFETLSRHRPDDPPFCMEFWCGWFEHWGHHRATRDPATVADTLRRILEAGADVNIYMAHGGTNFGTWSGANRMGHNLTDDYQATVTSYDYDAPIAEDGSPTEKFWRMRDVLAAYTDDIPDLPPAAARLPRAEIRPDRSMRLFDTITAGPVCAATPPTFEDLHLTHGLVLYRTNIPAPRDPAPLAIDGLADRAHLFIDGDFRAVLDATADTVEVPGGVRVDLLVESMGRTNYGPMVGERKGITGSVRHGLPFLHGWQAYPIELNSEIDWAAASNPDAPRGGPIYHCASLDVADPGDGFLTLPGWTKGYVWVNGFCLGRYWNVGPQHELYLPWSLLRTGSNEIVVLELDRVTDTTIVVTPNRPSAADR